MQGAQKGGAVTVLGIIERNVRTRAGRFFVDKAPDRLRKRWVSSGPVEIGWAGRLDRFRNEVIPWLDSTRSLQGRTILEVGAGEGASTFALLEQAAKVVGIDISETNLERGRQILEGAGLTADMRCHDAARLGELKIEGLDWIIYWASLEHMVIAERIATLRQAWGLLPQGGLLTVIETPNRLWPHDSHTSQLPFYSWLPDELAFAYAQFSPRDSFGGEIYSDPSVQMMDFLRRGRGLSFHEFDVALQGLPPARVKACMQLDRRRENRVRGLAWSMSSAGRAERLLRSFAPQRDRAWFQPFLYLTVEKG